MKAIVCTALGSPESLELRDVQLPPPGPREVRIRTQACGINFPDLLLVKGEYQDRPPLPFIPGGEVAGTVAEAGTGVTEYRPGDRVMAVTMLGGLAEFVNAKVENVMPLPAGMSMQAAAGFTAVYGTSYHALKQRANLKAGENLLVLGAAGGVGLAAVQIGLLMGARVIAAAGSDAKLDFLRQSGVHDLINYRSQDLREAVKTLTGGKGADVIYDPLGGDGFDQLPRCVAWNGRLLVVGFAAGRIPQLPMNLLLLKGASAVGVYYGRFLKEEPGEAERNHRELTTLAEQGKLRPHVHEVFPLEQAALALNAVKNREVIGKVIVECTR